MDRTKIVSFKLASLLKDNGYDDDTYFRINKDGMLATCGFLMNYNEDKLLFSAPTVSEAVDWAEDKYNIFIEVNYQQIDHSFENKFMYIVYDVEKEPFDGNMILESSKKFETKNKALEHTLIKFLSTRAKSYIKAQIKSVKEEIGIDVEINSKKISIN